MRWNDKPVYLCCGYTDMRKSINGLMTLVQESFSLDPFENVLFVFCNRSRNRLKILELFRCRNNSSYADEKVIPILSDRGYIATSIADKIVIIFKVHIVFV